MPLTLLTGGARSGKSALAVRAAASSQRPVALIATAQAGDAEFARRIARHQRERPSAWTVVEEPLELERAVLAVSRDAFLVVDCLSLWVANLVLKGQTEEAIAEVARRAARAAGERAAPTVAVTNEVGSGIVPVSASGRAYRDILGRVNQAWADAAERAALVVAGRLLALDEFDGAL